MGEAVANNTYHVPILRTVLTRKLEVLTDDIYDEVCHSFTDFLPPTDRAYGILPTDKHNSSDTVPRMEGIPSVR